MSTFPTIALILTTTISVTLSMSMIGQFLSEETENSRNSFWRYSKFSVYALQPAGGEFSVFLFSVMVVIAYILNCLASLSGYYLIYSENLIVKIMSIMVAASFLIQLICMCSEFRGVA
jgi:hypothetical protein